MPTYIVPKGTSIQPVYYYHTITDHFIAEPSVSTLTTDIKINVGLLPSSDGGSTVYVPLQPPITVKDKTYVGFYLVTTAGYTK